MALISFDLDGVLQRNPFYMGSSRGVFGHIGRELAPYVTAAGEGLAQPGAGVAQSFADGSQPGARGSHSGAGGGRPVAPLTEAEGLVVKRLAREHRRRMEADQIVAAHDWDSIVNQVAAELGYPREIDVADLVERYCQVEGLVYAYPGSHEVMDQLRAEGHTLVSITNGFRSYQAPVLRTIGLLAKFEALITPDLAGAGKPEVAIFRAAEAYGSPRIHIGDVLPHDIAGAKAAGWQGIYVVQPQAPGYTELPSAMAELAPWERPVADLGWLTARLEVDRRWHGHPPCELVDCMPDAVVQHLCEIPATVAYLLSGS